MPISPAQLDDLPVMKGFRQRGMAMTRIETFTDAAFAFALTLLVVSIGAETTDFDDLLSKLRFVPAFAAAAALLMVFWHGHHVWSRRFGLDDGPTIILSILLVFVVLVYVLPLRVMTEGMVIWVMSGFGTHLPGANDVSVEPDQINTMFALYGVGFTALGGVMVLLNWYAWRRRDALVLNELERHETRAEIGTWLILAAVGMLSVLVAWIGPPSRIGLPGWVYMLLPIVMPLYGRRMNRRRDAMLKAT